MKTRPLICHVESVRAIFAGTKTQTRRVVTRMCLTGQGKGYVDDTCPYGEIGDRLWVREPLRRSDDGRVQYTADGTIIDEVWPEGWRTPRLARWMPRRFCRLELEITNVRVERLQDIMDDDARAEGVSPAPYIRNQIWIANPENARRHVATYRRKWDALNAARGFPWTLNPWVWVVEFKRTGASNAEKQITNKN